MRARPAVGDAVIYRAHPQAAVEHGVVTGHSIDAGVVFVRYASQPPDANGRATRVLDLQEAPVSAEQTPQLFAEQAHVSARTLFEEEPCRCCSCCDGYCPDDDRHDRWPVFVEGTMAGREYVGTTRIIVARDRLVGMPEDGTTTLPLPASAGDLFKVPHAAPALFEGNHLAVFWDRLERAGGLTCRVAEAPRQVHLYLGDEHVGWMAHAAAGKGIRQDQLTEVRRIAEVSLQDLSTVETILTAATTSPAEEARRG